LARATAELPKDSTVIDGEIVALDEHGKPSFNLLQGFGSDRTVVLDAFDLLFLRGRNVRSNPSPISLASSGFFRRRSYAS
jgi:bifunctional non-homologous end joining protein LigD